MNELLTDDEIVALSVNVGKSWPLSLPTIANPELVNLQASNNRGVRSLAVRGLAKTSGAGALAINGELFDLATKVTSATSYLTAFVADRAHPVTVAGSSVTAYFGGDAAGAVVDSVTVSGVHAVREESPSDARAAVITFAETAFLGTTLTAWVATSLVVIVALASPGESTLDAVLVTPGTLERGVISSDDGGDPQFVQSAMASTWAPEWIAALG
jgi:hypothetical protein